MTFNDTDLYCQILGSIMKDPSVLGSLPMPIAIDDFSTENQIARVVFFSLSNLITFYKITTMHNYRGYHIQTN